jgi:predicted RNA methylase
VGGGLPKFPLIINRLFRAAGRAAQIARNEGLSAVVRNAFRRVRRSQLVDAFDQKYQVETANEVSLFQLDITGPNEVSGVRYQPSPVKICDELFSALPIRHEEFTFIDIGAGKGRVLLIASRFPFKRLIGVEFARELVETTRRNIMRFGARAEIVHADAANYRFPVENLVVYLYNPFGSKVLRPVLNSLREIGSTHEVYLLYLNPQNGALVEEFARQIYQRTDAKVYHF